MLCQGVTVLVAIVSRCRENEPEGDANNNAGDSRLGTTSWTVVSFVPNTARRFTSFLCLILHLARTRQDRV